MRKAATAKDVALLAGVSPATVSYVVNDTPGQRITPETRARVMAAVADLGYTPSATARALQRGASTDVLLVLPNAPIGPTMAEFLERVEAELGSAGLSLITRRLWNDRPVGTMWREIQPAAVIAIAGVAAADAREMRAAGVFLAQALLDPKAPDEATLTLPQTLIGRLQVEHLATRGHRVLGYGRPPAARPGAFLPLRLEGAREASVDLGLDLPDVREVPDDVARAATAVDAWRTAGVTAVAAYNDEVAFAILAALRDRGLAAPADLAVIGADNIPLARFAAPPLTTIDQNIGLVARHLAEVVSAGLDGRPLPRMPRWESLSLVIRQSV